MKRHWMILGVLSILTTAVRADGLKDNHPKQVRPVPRVGVEVSAHDRADLLHGLAELKGGIDKLRTRRDARTRELLADVEIFYRAVKTNLEHREFFSKRDIVRAKRLLQVGSQRAADLLAGRAPWTTQTGLVVRGYVSRIDRTVQPYGLVIPKSYTSAGARRFRCDLWFHGRGETLSETNFIDQRMRSRGRYTPRDTFVLHPYGRYSNAFKFAGEVDVLEALDSVRRRYRIDDDRTSVRGFSMGGAACWQFAVHYADRWFAANPGAGFAETYEFLKFFQHETLHPTPYERALWHMYDCTDYALNLYHCPTVAYSGELDTQKQAADIMQARLKAVGIDMLHIIGPGMHHQIHPVSAKLVERRMDSLAERGRRRVPRQVHFVTYTLKYNRMKWVTVNALGEHWKQARVDGRWNRKSRVALKTDNVTSLTLSMPAGYAPFDIRKPVAIQIDGQKLTAPRPKSDRSWEVRLHNTAAGWRIGRSSVHGLRKAHNLQGPIDDAFMDSFLIVRPVKASRHPQVEKWVKSELAHTIREWRRQFRGDARVKSAAEITAADMADSNLILFGDPTSNPVLARIADRLPIRWTEKSIIVGNRQFDATHHAPVLIYPNPLNPRRYVVLNSGFTYREYAYLNNARQVPMLPDWAVVDLRTPPGTQYPGKIVAADFFDEQWQLRPVKKP